VTGPRAPAARWRAVLQPTTCRWSSSRTWQSPLCSQRGDHSCMRSRIPLSGPFTIQLV
jgi:hypothetical protein